MISDVVTNVARIQDVLAGMKRPRWTVRERAERARYRSADRQRAWDAGRILAKQALCDLGGVRPETCEVLSRDARGTHVRSNVFSCGRRVPIPMSISHQNDTVAVAVGTNPQLAVGVDVVATHDLGAAFLSTWFSRHERAWIDQDPLCVATAWGIKEAIYKAVSRKESFAPRQIEVLRDSYHDYAFRYHGWDLSERCEMDVRQDGDCVVVTLAVWRDVRRFSTEYQDSSNSLSFNTSK